MTLFTCMHPHASRERVGTLEVCGSCREVREASRDLWAATARVQMRVGDEWWTLMADGGVVVSRKQL